MEMRASLEMRVRESLEMQVWRVSLEDVAVTGVHSILGQYCLLSLAAATAAVEGHVQEKAPSSSVTGTLSHTSHVVQ